MDAVPHRRLTPNRDVKRALVAAEALPPSLRAWLEARGVATLQCYAIADVGLVASKILAQLGTPLQVGDIAYVAGASRLPFQKSGCAVEPLSS